jgi:hypothetical protein
MEIARDPEHPQIEPGPRLELFGPGQRPFDGSLQQIVARIPIALERKAQAAKPGQQPDETLGDFANR